MIVWVSIRSFFFGWKIASFKATQVFWGVNIRIFFFAWRSTLDYFVYLRELTMFFQTADKPEWHWFRSSQAILATISVLTILWCCTCYCKTWFQARRKITMNVTGPLPKLLLSMIKKSKLYNLNQCLTE